MIFTHNPIGVVDAGDLLESEGYDWRFMYSNTNYDDHTISLQVASERGIVLADYYEHLNMWDETLAWLPNNWTGA